MNNYNSIILQEVIKHLPGKHNQMHHGRHAADQDEDQELVFADNHNETYDLNMDLLNELYSNSKRSRPFDGEEDQGNTVHVNGGWRIDQHYGYHNSAPDLKIEKVVGDWYKAYKRSIDKSLAVSLSEVTKHLAGQHDQSHHDPRQYPKTAHFPQSPGKASDDVTIKDVSKLIGVPIVASEKMDGANINMDADTLGVRGGDLTLHPAFNRVKRFYQGIKDKIPSGYQLAVEDTSYLHAITYDALPNPPHFLLNVLDTEKDEWLPDEDVDMFAEDLSMPRPPKLFQGMLRDEQDLSDLISDLANKPSGFNTTGKEGFVVRQQGSIPYVEFNTRVAKWVRPGHVAQNEEHWLSKPLVANKIDWNK